MATTVQLPDPTNLPSGYTIIVEGDGGTTIFSVYRGTWEHIGPLVDMRLPPDPLIRGYEPSWIESAWFYVKYAVMDALEVINWAIHKPLTWWIIVALLVCLITYKLDREGNRESD